MNVTLQALMFHAYGYDPDKILGGPGWAQSQRYDIDARAAREVTRDEAYAMLRTLLEALIPAGGIVPHASPRLPIGRRRRLARPAGV